MNPIVEVQNIDKCSLIITDVTQDSNEYIPEDEVDVENYYARNRFKYSETYTINVIVQYTLDTVNSGKIIDVFFNDHCSQLDELHYTIKEDGYYEIYHIILPSKAWYDLGKIPSNLDIYFTDGEQLYKVENGIVKTTDLVEIINAKCEGNTISQVSLAQFSICKLFDCYINICKQIFENALTKCPKNNDLTYKRDLIWMTINVIKYYVELGQLMEAQRLLEELIKCGGICNDTQSPGKKSCGCSR